MEGLVKGDVVIVQFPFNDLSGSKRRPALVLAVKKSKTILCQITSQAYFGEDFVPIMNDSFAEGGLPLSSFALPFRLFTADSSIVSERCGSLHPEITEAAINTLCATLQS